MQISVLAFSVTAVAESVGDDTWPACRDEVEECFAYDSQEFLDDWELFLRLEGTNEVQWSDKDWDQLCRFVDKGHFSSHSNYGSKPTQNGKARPQEYPPHAM